MQALIAPARAQAGLGRSLSTRSPACAPRRWLTSTATSSSSRPTSSALGGHVFFAADAAEARRHVVGLAQRARRPADREVQVDGHRGDRPEPGARGGRRGGRRDRPRRVHRPARPRAAVPHRRAGHPHVARADPRAVLGGRRSRRRGRPGGHDPLRPRRAAREVLRRRHGHLGRQLRRGRDGLGRAGHQRGQRTHGDDAAAHPRRGHGRGAPGARASPTSRRSSRCCRAPAWVCAPPPT